MKVIDIHSHFFPKTWPSLQEKFGGDDWPSLKHLGADENGFERAMLMKGEQEFRPIYSACWDPDIRLQQMDEHGLNSQIISATPILFAYEKPVEQALYCAQLFNDAALEICSRGKGRLFAMAQVPLQDADAACKEASRAMKSGHVGIQINELSELDSKLKEAFAIKNRLVFVDVNVDEKEHVYPMQIRHGSIDEMWIKKGVQA